MGDHKNDCGRERDERLIRSCQEDPSLLSTLTPQELGRLGEAIAWSFLQQRGYALVCQGYRCPEGEADLVVLDVDSDETVLVEVKTRRLSASGDTVYPELAVDERKRRRYARIAACYVLEHFPVRSMRFDVIAVTLLPGFRAEIEHLYAAFEWDGDR